VTRETLLASSEQHVGDIRAGLAFFADLLHEAGVRHDHDKITAIDHFHADFRTGFAQTGWWDNHRRVNRHHLTEADGIPADVNLIDVLDFITDCVMAGLARSGSVRPLAIEPAVLQRAFDNTAALLCSSVEVVPAPASPVPAPSPRACLWHSDCDAAERAHRPGFPVAHCPAPALPRPEEPARLTMIVNGTAQEVPFTNGDAIGVLAHRALAAAEYGWTNYELRDEAGALVMERAPAVEGETIHVVKPIGWGG
jgi:hypothetical protein